MGTCECGQICALVAIQAGEPLGMLFSTESALVLPNVQWLRPQLRRHESFSVLHLVRPGFLQLGLPLASRRGLTHTHMHILERTESSSVHGPPVRAWHRPPCAPNLVMTQL